MTETPDDDHLLQAAVRELPLPFCVLDATGVVRYANRAWLERAPGAPGAAASGAFNYLRSLETLAARGDVHAQLLRDGIASVLTGAAPRFRLEHPLDATRRSWQLLHAEALPDAGALITHVDVTARRAAEARLRRLARRYRAVTDAIGAGLWDLDVAGRTVTVDATICELLGRPHAPALRWTDVHALVHADDVGSVESAWNDAARDRDPGQGARIGPLELRLIDAKGAHRWFECRGHVMHDESGRAVSAQGTLHDVTERRTAQDALARSNAHLQEMARRLVALEPPADTTDGT